MDLPLDTVTVVVATVVVIALTHALSRRGGDARSVLLTRRSHMKSLSRRFYIARARVHMHSTRYAPKAVPPTVVRRALDAAVLAPNHFLSEPWRFYQCGAATLAKIAALNADKAAALPPNAMIVTLKSAHALDAKLGLEDHAAVACACQNFMLSLHADGVASKWMTGAMGIAPEKLVDVAGAPADEKLMGVLWFGYAAEPAKAAPKRKLGVDGVFTKLG